MTLLFKKRLKRKSRTLVQDSRRFAIFSQKEGQYVVVVVVCLFVVVVFFFVFFFLGGGGNKLGQNSRRYEIFSQTQGQSGHDFSVEKNKVEARLNEAYSL